MDKSFGKFSEKNQSDFAKYQKNDNPRRGSDRKKSLMVFGFLFLLVVESVLLFVVLQILRDSQIITWRPDIGNIVSFSAVTLLWRAFNRSVFNTVNK